VSSQQVVTGPPDFIGVGAQRSGTTWWFELLLQHPQIGLSRRGHKEVHFFDRYGAEPMRDEDVRRYHWMFPRTQDGVLVGEWTPRYMLDPWTPRLLHRAAPDARLLVLLRDPIERFRSGILHRAVRTPDHDLGVMAGDALQRGRYATQIRHLLEYFDPSQLLVLQYERCVLDPVGEYRRTLAFLGVEDETPRDVTLARGESMAEDKEPLWPELLLALRTVLDPEVRELGRLAPDLDLALWPHFDHLTVAS
jgi:hypothetical protein